MTEKKNPLSKRQKEVLQVASTGASNQEIAEELVISIHTVKVHMRNIFEKLEVQSRTEATMRAIQEGWITLPEVDEEETEIVSTKTFLLETRQPPLVRWQKFYLLGATLLALLTMTIPLFDYAKNSTPSSTPIYLPSPIVKDDNKLYEEEATPLPPAAYDERVNRWQSRQTMPTNRAGLGIVGLENKIFAIGGVRKNQATRWVEIYDILSDSWREGAAKPTATADIHGVVFDKKIYIPGGCGNDGSAVEIMEIYDPETDSWQEGNPLPAPRCGYGLALYEEKLYLFGGWDGERYVDTIFTYSFSDEEWKILETTLPKARGYMGATSLEESIYLVGGHDDEQASNQTYQFDPETGRWEEKSPMHEKRGGLGLTTDGENLYAIGGGWNAPVQFSEKYNPSQDSWTTFETPFETQWHNLGLVTIDNQMYAIGGWDGKEKEYMGTMVTYQIIFQQFLPITIQK